MRLVDYLPRPAQKPVQANIPAPAPPAAGQMEGRDAVPQSGAVEAMTVVKGGRVFLSANPELVTRRMRV